MIANFSKKSSINIIFLLLYAIALKWRFFSAPSLPVINHNDGLLYKMVVNYWGTIKNGSIFASLAAFCLLFLQAIQISTLAVKHKFFPTVNYLPGMAYILITSLFPDWNALSSGLIFNSFILFVFKQSLNLTSTNNAKTLLFNIGLIIGLSNFIYEFSFILALLVWFVLGTYRAFKWNEYLMILLGIVIPYYFTAALYFLKGIDGYKQLLPQLHFYKQNIKEWQLLFTTAMVLLSVTLLGLLFVQNNNRRLPIQSRKVWGIAVFLFLLTFFIPFICGDVHFWIILLVAASLFVAAFFYYLKPIKLVSVIHWLIFGYALFIHYYY